MVKDGVRSKAFKPQQIHNSLYKGIAYAIQECYDIEHTCVTVVKQERG